METLSVSSVFAKGTRHFAPIQSILVAALVLGAYVPSAAASDYASQVTQARLFMEPLHWVGNQPPPDDESLELLGTVGIFKSDGVGAGFVALEHFLDEHPQSAWAPALEVNMAEYYRRIGRYSLALSHWQAAWNATKDSKDTAGQKIAVQAFAGWTRLLASLGHKKELEALYKELDTLHLRLGGYATTIEETKEGMETMNGRPGISYRCGSYALGHLAMALGAKQPTIQKLFSTDSPDGGFTMSELLALAKTNGLAIEAVKRPSGAELVVPCVVHWKLNHYAAIVGKQGDRYLVEDPTFERSVLMDAATIDTESSGDFILPKGKVPSSWKQLSRAECTKIYGKGVSAIFNDPDDSPQCSCPPCGNKQDSNNNPPASNDGADGGKNPPNAPPGCGGKQQGGMPQWSVHEPYITLWLTDVPLLYHRSDDTWVQLIMTYKHRGEAHSTEISGFGDKWSCNWLDMLQQLSGSAQLTDWIPGGGLLPFPTVGAPTYKDALVLQTNCANIWTWYAIDNGLPPLTVCQTITTPSGSLNAYKVSVGDAMGDSNYLAAVCLDRYGRIQELFNYATNNGVVQLTSVVDMDGRTNTLTYGNSTFPNLITAVTDPYGNTAHFNYDNNRLLTNIVDAQGMSSYFRYDGSEAITNMITPYGTNIFQYFDGVDSNLDNVPDRAILITEANGDHQLYAHVAYSPDPSGFSGGDPFAQSYHWNRRQYELISDQTNVFTMPGSDYELASVKSWMYNSISQSNSLYSGILSDTLFGQADPVDPATGFRPNEVEYEYVGSGDDGEGMVVGSLNAVTYISLANASFGITRNTLGRPTSYTYYDGQQDVLATYTNIFDSSGTILQYELGPNNELTRGYGYDPVITNLLTSVTNALGDVLRYTHATNSLKVTSIAFPGGLVRTNIYYTNGPSAGFLAQQIDLGIRTNYFAYTNGNLSALTNELGLVTTYTYDNLNRLTSIAYPDGTTTSNIYNNLDIVATKDRLNQWTHYEYNAVQQLIAVTNANNQVTTYDYCGCGSPDEIICWNGSTQLITLLNYDIIGRLTNAVYPDGYQLSYGFDDMDRVTSITDGDGNQLDLSWYEYGLENLLQSTTMGGQYLLRRFFDTYGRVISIYDRNNVIVTNGYDFLDRLVARQASGAGLENFGYSARGLTNYTDTLGHVTTFVRDNAGRVLAETNANQEVLQFTYDPADELLSLTDGKNQTTTWKYDQYGRVTNKLDANNTNLFVYQYDADNRLTNRWTAAKGTTVYRYDPIGNLTNVDYSGGTVYTPSINFAYDGLNRLTNMLDGLGATAFAWTQGNQLAGENGPWLEDAVAYTYDTGSRQRTRLSILQPNASPWAQTYDYDSMMRLADVFSSAGDFNYSYNLAGGDLVSELRFADDWSIFAYNSFDGLTRLTSTTLSTPFGNSQRTYYYDAGSEVTQQVFTANNVMDYSYDKIGQLKTAQGFESGGTTARLQEQFGYAYDKAWNLNTRTNNALIQNFTVNNVNELSSAGRSGTLTVAGTTTELGADVTSVTVSGTGLSSGAATEYADGTWARAGATPANGANSYTAVATDTYGRTDSSGVTVSLPASPTYSYDSNGNLTNDATRNFAYDDENQLISVWVANVWSNSFVYDGLLRKRVEKDYSWTGSAWLETNEVHFIYDGYVVAQERDGNNLPRVTYTRGLDLSGNESPLLGQMVDGFQGAGGIGGLLARTDMGLWVANEPFSSAYYFNDAQGNVVAMVNTNGAVVAQYAYDPFGNTLSMSGPMASANRYRFSSKEWNESAGLYYYGFRFYDPNLQRWLNRDPIQERGGINLFGFVRNNPLSWYDELGLCPPVAGEMTAGQALARANQLAAEAEVLGGGPEDPWGDAAALAVWAGLNAYALSLAFDQMPPISGYGPQANYGSVPGYGANAPPTSLVFPASTTPSGPPPVAVPGAPGASWTQTGPQRGGVPSWVPNQNVPTTSGGQPSASWDSPNGHWDVDDGNGNRQRYDWRGNPVNPDQAHDPNAPQPPGNNPSPCPTN